MAIGTGLALLGSAAIGAGAGLIGGSKQTKAAKDAARIATEDNAANRAFLTSIYNRNVENLSPWMRTGQTANNAYMELLGLPQAPPQQPAFGYYGQPYSTPGLSTPSAFTGFGMEPSYGAMQGRQVSPFDNYQLGAPTLAQPGPGAVTPQTPGVPTPNARSAFDTYRGSTGYDFRFNEGIRALQSAFSRNLESGAATKAAMRFGQGIGSDEFARYMQLLGDQSRLGFGGASALAGVGQNFGNTVTAGNTAAASAAANARLYGGTMAAQNWANLGSSFGNALGYFLK